MRISYYRLLTLLLVNSIVLFYGGHAQGTAQQPPAAPKEEILMAEDLTRILKEEWQYLKDETDAYLKSTESKAEFETKQEYADRVARLKAAFVSKINSHIAEKKFDKRVFAVLFKAKLASYSPDSGRYSISSGTIIDAPYNTPTIKCSIPPNNYVGLADSATGGYRSSKLYLKFRPNFVWTTGRDAARTAKSEEANVFFKVTMTLDLSQAEIKDQANIKIMPKEISLVNRQNMQKLWDGGQIRILPPVAVKPSKRRAKVKEPVVFHADSTSYKPTQTSTDSASVSKATQKQADSTSVSKPK